MVVNVSYETTARSAITAVRQYGWARSTSARRRLFMEIGLLRANATSAEDRSMKHRTCFFQACGSPFFCFA